MSAPLIHIGYHKTGTTWLQTHVFGNEAAGYVTPVDPMTAIREVVGPKDLCFDPKDCRALCDLVSAGGRHGLVPVISCERFSGNPHSGGYDSREIAGRLARLFPTARILIVVREQVAAIASCYYQYIAMGGTLSLTRYVAGPGDFIRPGFRFAHFAYDRLIQVYFEHYGAENVCVLTYEGFVESPLDFLSRVRAFARSKSDPAAVGLPVTDRLNVSLSGWRSAIQRRVNMIAAPPTSLNHQAFLRATAATQMAGRAVRFAGFLIPEHAHRSHDAALCARVEAAVEDRYARSNRKVCALTGLTLAREGYRV